MPRARIVGWERSKFGRAEEPDLEALLAGVVGLPANWLDVAQTATDR